MATRQTTAQHLVTLASIPDNQGAKWHVVAEAYNGEAVKEKKRGLWTVSGHRFPDGSAVSYNQAGEPVVFLGKFKSEE